MLKWFYRFTAVHFIVTALTGLVLYFRPLDDRPGWYSETIKEIFVGLHNGELWGQLIFHSRYSTGIPIGVILSSMLLVFTVRRLMKNRKRSQGLGSDHAKYF